MIKTFTDSAEFQKFIRHVGMDIDIESMLHLEFPFVENRDKFTVISVPDYSGENHQNILAMSKDHTVIYSDESLEVVRKELKVAMKKAYGESTVMTLVLIRTVLKNYSRQFEKIRAKMNDLDLDPVLDDIEKAGRDLRRLTDRIEELVQLMMTLKEKDLKEFDTSLIQVDYDLLFGEARYWLERCRSHIYRIASLRTKSEMKSNKQLNDTMGRLTVIMTFLTIVSIVINVPGSVGAIFGIPALSDAYFEKHINLLVVTLVTTTLLSVILGYVYWRSLKLGQKEN